MTETLDFTVVFRLVEDGWTQAHIREVPGVLTAAPSREEAAALIPDALREYLLALGDVEGPAAGRGTDGGVEQRLALTVEV